jgi:hypothetical protein
MNRKERIGGIFITLWVFINVLLWIIAKEESGTRTLDFWYPFTYEEGYNDYGGYYKIESFELGYYDVKEFMVYAILPLIIFISYLFVKKAKK